MLSDNELRRLHDRSTRGEALSNDEQESLRAWNVEQDDQEAAVLARPDDALPLGTLREQVDEAISQLRLTARQIEEVTAENDAIRQEIATLQNRLTRLANVQPA